MGKFVSSYLTGRPYDPDVFLTFEAHTGNVYTIQWNMGIIIFYELITPSADDDPTNID